MTTLRRRLIHAHGGRLFSIATSPATETIATRNVPGLKLEVPAQPTSSEVDGLSNFFEQNKFVTVLTGAGISTPSGIPDYRGPSGSYKLGHKPMVHSEFMTKEASRKRFWARSMIGWQAVSSANPNAAHTALAQLEHRSKVHAIITQNVDRLHHRAGSQSIIDLHGRVDQVRCQCCQKAIPRHAWQEKLLAANGHFLQELETIQRNMRSRMATATAFDRSKGVRADGDAELGIEDYSKMVVPACEECGGIIKLDVVMFGDNVPGARVASAHAAVQSSDALLVVGTSLEVFSAYRFVHAASAQGKPIAIVNFGQTRAEREQLRGIVFKSEANCAELLQAVAEQLLRSAS